MSKKNVIIGFIINLVVTTFFGSVFYMLAAQIGMWPALTVGVIHLGFWIYHIKNFIRDIRI